MTYVAKGNVVIRFPVMVPVEGGELPIEDQAKFEISQSVLCWYDHTPVKRKHIRVEDLELFDMECA